MYKFEAGVFMYKYSNDSLPDGFTNFFTTRSEIHDYHTRLTFYEASSKKMRLPA